MNKHYETYSQSQFGKKIRKEITHSGKVNKPKEKALPRVTFDFI